MIHWRSHTNTPIRAGSAEPAGGAARFQSVVNFYRSDPRFAGQPGLLTFFSGDVFNPSLESTVTKGRHMVPFLNKAGIDVACVGVSMLSVSCDLILHMERSQK